MSIHFYNVVPQSQNISIDEPIIIGDAAHKFCVIGNVLLSRSIKLIAVRKVRFKYFYLYLIS